MKHIIDRILRRETPTMCQFTWYPSLWDDMVQCRLPFNHGGTFHQCGNRVTPTIAAIAKGA
jgi:hypothetical protein